ncbi:MAG: tetratricopeptide repeat protein [Rubrivivax sp.]|nr:tetratricopeptide repeat protein [Rubrivivax sp.]
MTTAGRPVRRCGAPGRPGTPGRVGLVALAAVAALAGCASKDPNKRPPGDDAPTLVTLASRSVELPKDGGIATDEAKAMSAYRAFLEVAGRDAPQRPEVMRRLADLEMDLADRKSADGGAVPDYKGAVAQYEKVLREHPNAPGNDRVLYQLARAQEQGGDLEAALKTLTRVTKDYPDTIHRDEVHFRRGELLFATRDYVGAGEAYATVLRSSATTPFTERALYMRGWSLFKQAKLDEALEPFFKVLDLKLGGPPSPGPDPLAHLTRADKELLEDTHRVMSLSLANLEGAAAIGKYVTSPDPADVRRGYEHRVYIELAELFLKQDRPKDAADTLAFYARLRPLATPAPELLARVIDIHEAKGFPRLALEAKRDFVSRYGRTSEFRKANAEGWRAAQPRVKAHLAELARHHHAATQQTRSRADLQEAVRWYRELLTAFPDDGEVVQQRFLLAELLFEDKQFVPAMVEYETVAYGRPTDALAALAGLSPAAAPAKPAGPAFAKAADAGYAALLAYAEQAKGAPGAGERVALERASVASALSFAAAFAHDSRVGSVTTNAAESLLKMGDAEGATRVARQALAGPTSTAEQRTAWAVIAVSAFDRQQFADAEQAFGQAMERAGSGTREAGDLAERRAAAIHKQGDAARSAGRMREAIGHFERLATLAPQPGMRAAAQFDVATALIGLKDWPAATASLEDFRRRHPTHALQADVPAKLALAYTEQKRWTAAAGEFDRIAASAGDPALRRSAQWQVADMHERALAEAPSTAARRQVITAYERYASAWPQPLEAATEARWKLVQLTRADGQAARSVAWTKALRSLELTGGAARTPRSKALSSLAAIELARPLRDAYDKVKLVEPLAANLKRKKAAMETVLKAYADASADGAAEAVTAATFHTAALYQDFGKAMLGSQRPRKLKKLELEQYNVLLEEQAFPFEEKAIQLHETNARRTQQGFYDEWIRHSLAALATLKPVRWAKTERSEEALDVVR